MRLAAETRKLLMPMLSLPNYGVARRHARGYTGF
jgi:hypothetical protein